MHTAVCFVLHKYSNRSVHQQDVSCWRGDILHKIQVYRYIYDISETNTSGESAGNSTTASLLRSLIEIIRKSNKTSGHIITEQKRNLKFPLTDLITIRKFAQIAGIKIDERKFRNRREFQMYFRELMKEED